MNIRLAHGDDCKAIHRFVNELEEADFDFDLFESIYLKNISNPDNIYLVAEDDNKVVIGYISCHGQLLLHHCGEVFEIVEMFVSKEFRNAGIGKLLIQLLEDELKKRNCVSLEVTSNNYRVETHQFYKRVGFKNTHQKFIKKI